MTRANAMMGVPERDLERDRDHAPDHDTLDHLRDEGLIRTIALGDHDQAIVLTNEGRHLLDANRRERVLPRAADLWVQASLEQRQRFQQLFFPRGIAFDGNSVVRTAATAPAFNYLRQIEAGNEGLVDQNSASWNQISDWLRRLDSLRETA